MNERLQTNEGGIMCQGGECAAGIFPLRGFFNNPLKGGVISLGAFSTAPYMRPAPKGGAAYTTLIRDDCAQAKTPEKGEYVCQL